MEKVGICNKKLLMNFSVIIFPLTKNNAIKTPNKSVIGPTFVFNFYLIFYIRVHKTR